MWLTIFGKGGIGSIIDVLVVVDADKNRWVLIISEKEIFRIDEGVLTELVLGVSV